MGGNVIIDNATPQPITNDDRVEVFAVASDIFRKATNRGLGPSHFSGSTSFLFSFSLILPPNKMFGDVDLIVPAHEKEEIKKRLFNMKRNCRLYQIKGAKVHGTEISIIVWVRAIDKVIQIDFEFKPCNEYGFPTEFSRFSQCSPVEDWNEGIKGVYHKQLICALCCQHMVELPDNTSVPLYTFSVAKGLRHTTKIDYSEPGCPRSLLKPADAAYITEVDTIARALLNLTDPFVEARRHLSSFHSICRYMEANWADQYMAVCDDFYSRILGKKNRVNRPEEEKRWVVGKMCELIPSMPFEPSEPLSAQEDSQVPL